MKNFLIYSIYNQKKDYFAPKTFCFGEQYSGVCGEGQYKASCEGGRCKAACNIGQYKATQGSGQCKYIRSAEQYKAICKDKRRATSCKSDKCKTACDIGQYKAIQNGGWLGASYEGGWRGNYKRALGGLWGKFAIKAIVIGAVVSLVASCSWQMPSEIAVKTKATYNWAIGSFDRKLSEDFSMDTIQDELTESSKDEDGKSRFTVYDYNPGGDARNQQYLIDFPIQELPVDFGEYLKKMDFSDELEKMSMHQEVTVPDLSEAGKFEEVYTFPDISEVLRTMSHFGVANCFVPLGVNGKVPESISGTDFRPEFEINIADPDFGTFEFTSGAIELHLDEGEVVDATVIHDSATFAGRAPLKPRLLPEGYRTAVTIELYDSTGNNLIAKSTNVNLATQNVVSLPLGGAKSPITKKLLVRVNGSTWGGEATKFMRYQIQPKLSSDTVLKKATGLTIPNDQMGDNGTIHINNSSSLKAPAGFISSTIGDESLTNISKVSLTTTPLPSTWSGVKFDRNITISGVMDATEAEFNTDGETGAVNENVILGRYLPLRNKVLRSGDLQVTGTVAISLEDATIVLNGGTISPIKLNVNTTITKMNEVVVDMEAANPGFNSVVTYEKSLGDDVTDYVSAVKMRPSGVTVSYVNTLPNARDNDIKLQLQSDFLNLKAIDGMGTLQAGGINADAFEEFDILGSASEDEIPITSSTKIDMTATMALPGNTPDHPNYAVFKELEPNKKYTLDVSVTPKFDWDYIIVNTDNIATQTDSDAPVDTGLNFVSMFNSLLDRFPDEEQGFINRIDFQKIPLYLYAVVPDITPEGSTSSLADDIAFEGTFIANIYNGATAIGEPLYILGDEDSDGDLEPIRALPKLVAGAGNGIITTDLSKGEVEEMDIKELFNSHLDGTVKINYNFNMVSNGLKKTGLKIKKDALPDDGEDTTLSILLHARIVLPMSLEITQDKSGATDEERRQPLKINLSHLIYDGDKSDSTDMLGRDESTDISDFEKFIDAGKAVGAGYTLENDYFVYSSGSSAKMTLKTDDSDLFDNGSLMAIFDSNGTVKFSTREAKKILQTYPFAPDLLLTLPLGEAYIPRDAKIRISFTLFANTDGQINLMD